MKVEEKRAGRGWRPQVVNLKNDFQKKRSGWRGRVERVNVRDERSRAMRVKENKRMRGGVPPPHTKARLQTHRRTLALEQTGHVEQCGVITKTFT